MAGRIKSNNYVERPRDIFAKPKLNGRSPSHGAAKTLQPKDILKTVPASVWALGVGNDMGRDASIREECGIHDEAGGPPRG